MSDSQLGELYVCERCVYVFDWAVAPYLPHGRARDGPRVCPRCGVEFVRKFRESDLGHIMERFRERFVQPDVVVQS